ncbi:MAG: hypothetical protein H6573_00860 [Lewinellaceae bacterium]|nr:hypothetical protein [Phaeodactylibacter sp.]MCB9346046.1 hypothetical protein [Lewinellaceae bacterium]
MKMILSTLLTLALLATIHQLAEAQCWNGRQKTGYFDVNIGLGLLPTYAKDGGRPAGLPISASLNYRIQKNFSLGAFAGYSFTHGARVFRGSETAAPWQNRTTVAGLRFAAYSNLVGNWEFYGGMAGGVHNSRFDIMEAEAREKALQHGFNTQKSKLYATGFLGARFCLRKNLSLFTEVGMGDSLLKAGVSWRF